MVCTCGIGPILVMSVTQFTSVVLIISAAVVYLTTDRHSSGKPLTPATARGNWRYTNQREIVRSF